MVKDNASYYIYGPGGEIIEQIDSNGNAYYYHGDQLGSIRAITNSSGTVVDSYSYDAYGNTTASSGTVGNQFRYAGEYQDAESNLYYLRARYYDPATQQFLTVDPLVGWSEQAYAYVGGGPVTLTDPSGEVAYLTHNEAEQLVRVIERIYADTGNSPLDIPDVERLVGEGIENSRDTTVPLLPGRTPHQRENVFSGIRAFAAIVFAILELAEVQIETFSEKTASDYLELAYWINQQNGTCGVAIGYWGYTGSNSGGGIWTVVDRHAGSYANLNVQSTVAGAVPGLEEAFYRTHNDPRKALAAPFWLDGVSGAIEPSSKWP